MTGLDWAVFTLYVVLILMVGLYQSRKSSGVEGYFLGNRSLSWGLIGLSVMATQASAITFIGTTGQSYAYGMKFVQVYLPQPLVMVVLCVLFVPFFYRRKIYTAYEFLEQRFDARTRSLTSFLFLVSRGLAAGIVLYAPAVVLSVLMGWDERVTVLIMGAVTILYTAAGGITAVIWTDVLQMLLMFGGIGAALLTLFGELPPQVGVADVFYIGGIEEMWKSVDLSPDPRETYTLWSGLVGGFFLALAYFGCDQSQVQRYLTAKSLTQSRLALLFNAFLKVPMQIFILAIGVLLFVFYHFEQPPLIFNPAEEAQVRQSGKGPAFEELEKDYRDLHSLRREATLDLLQTRREGGDPDPGRSQIREYHAQMEQVRGRSKELVETVQGRSSTDVNYVFPSYLVQYVPAGILGLMIAVIFAAAMSSLDSELTALSSATVMDFYRRYLVRRASTRHYLWAARLTTLAWGVLATGVALYVGQQEASLLELVNKVGSYFYGSLLGVFLLAFLAPWATARGAFWGLILGMASVWAVSEFTALSFLYYNVVGCLTVVAAAFLLKRR